ncbi:hypothetical protein ACQVTT_05135 [Bacillus mycoides]|uniref:hypothetical protein n=1 Tax=Bacillus mycoides TaxID=1405 RepID=UPI003D65783D
MEAKDIIEISKIIVPVMSGLGGVVLGSFLTLNNNVKVQKKFTKQKIYMEKIQEVNRDLMELLREISIILTNMTSYLNQEITREEFVKINDNQQEKITALRRKLIVNQVFYREYQEDVDKFYNRFIQFSGKIYETYINPKTQNQFYRNDEMKFDEIKQAIIDCQKYGGDIVKKLNEKLEKELEDLK